MTTTATSAHIAQARSHFNISDFDLSGIHKCGHQICGVAGAIGSEALAQGGPLGSTIGKKIGEDHCHSGNPRGSNVIT